MSPEPREEGEWIHLLPLHHRLQLGPSYSSTTDPICPLKTLYHKHCTPSKPQPSRDLKTFLMNTLLPIWEETQKSPDLAMCCSRFTDYTGSSLAEIQWLKTHLNGGAAASGKQQHWRGGLLPATNTYCSPCLASSHIQCGRDLSSPLWTWGELV